MPRKALATSRGGQWLRITIVVMALLALAQTARDISRPTPGEKPAPSASPVVENGPALNAERRVEIELLVSQVATVCPSSALELRDELLAGIDGGAVPEPRHELTAYHAPPTASITSVRVAQRPLRIAANSVQPAPGGWLVSPDAWYVPEDSVPDQAPATPREPEESLPVEPEVPAAAPATEDTLPSAPPESPPLPEVINGPPELESAPTIVEPTPARLPQPPVAKEEGPSFTFEVQEPPSVPVPAVETPPLQHVAPEPARRETPEPTREPQSRIEPQPELPALRIEQAAELPAPAESAPSLPQPQEQPSAAPQTSSPPARSFAPPPAGMPSLHGGDHGGALGEAREKARAAGVPEGVDPHLELLAEGCYPSAKTCAKCHEKIYKEWSCSSHAYAAISPMFHKFEQKITEVSMGTVGYFCQRCHSPVGTSLCLPRDMPLWKQPAVAREGVTCVACHRVNQRYGKSNGERHIVPGDQYAPVYGGKGGVGVAEAIAKKEHFKLKTSPAEQGPGQPIHVEGRYFDQLSASEYCTTCHQVAVHPGIKLEVVWEQYRASPAHKQGITCQDCHMGKVPGVPSGYECCAIAEIAGKKVRDNVKHSNHTFYGPGYSIAHPGVFPFHLKGDRWTMDQWLQFDWRAGWGTDEFEDRVESGEIRAAFPKVWSDVDDRYDAREIIEDNQKLLAYKTDVRKAVMENGSHVDGPFFETDPRVGRELKLHYVVSNTNTGHNLPTASLGAQPQLWANVVLIGPRGQRLWETGYTDHYGDVCDIHSRDVRQGKVPFDSQLFNLQTMFLITGAVGTDREFFLPVNVDFDQLPFLRPGAIPVSVTNHPPFIRMESRSLAPLGSKRVKYRIPAEALCEPGRYRLSFRMRSRAEPIYFMDFCGATCEMQRAMNEGVIDVHPYSVEFNVR